MWPLVFLHIACLICSFKVIFNISNKPDEKSSTGGAADTLGAAFLAGSHLSSSDVFGLPLTKEGGRKGSDDSLLAVLVGTKTLGPSSSFSSSSSPSVRAVLVYGKTVFRSLNFNPGPLPPPKTRSCGGGATVVFCLGVGSMFINEEAPAPVLWRFAAGRSDSILSCSSLSFLESAGSPMAIFFDVRFVVLAEDSGVFDVDREDFVLSGWFFVGCGFSVSLPLPLSLP